MCKGYSCIIYDVSYIPKCIQKVSYKSADLLERNSIFVIFALGPPPGGGGGGQILKCLSASRHGSQQCYPTMRFQIPMVKLGKL